MTSSKLFILILCMSLFSLPTLAQQQDTLRTVTKDVAEVDGHRLGTVRGVREVENVQKINERELFKAACCNLSESFETNPSVDVSYTDAASGNKQIQMLGLSGIYMQTMTENRPDVRGIYAPFGLAYTPGTWVQSMQLTKGAGSVVNGFESMTGSLNVEQKKPDSDELLYLNLYANHLGRLEGNVVTTTKLTDRFSVAVLGHWDQWQQFSANMDRNKDGFMDMPNNTSHNWQVRMKHDGDDWKWQLGGRFLTDYRELKQDHNAEHVGHLWPQYVARTNTTHWDGFAKLGRVFRDAPYRSLGFIANATSHLRAGTYGPRDMQASQYSLYLNAIYQDIWGTTDNKFRTGISYQHDDISEATTLRLDRDSSRLAYSRLEVVPGVFYEHTWTANDALTVVAGLRADWNSRFGAFLTPRLHVKYSLNENNTLRFSAGRGQRTANLVGDNAALLPTNRVTMVNGRHWVNAYDLAPEVSWNYGLSLSHDFELWEQNGTLVLDAYRTDFEQMVVADWERAGYLRLYNARGAGYSNSLQAEVNYQPMRRMEVRMAYRWYQVMTNYQNEAGTGSSWQERPLVAAHRAFVNWAYTTRNKWNMDLTASVTGNKRLASTVANPSIDRLPDYSPAFFQLNAQVTKSFKPDVDVYLGVENLLDYRQEQLLVAPDRPFGPTFDASFTWGPVMGRVVYIGVRWKVKRGE